MDLMPENANTTYDKRLQELEKQSAVMDVRFEQINQNISEIKNNHILHINDQLIVISKTINDNNTSLVSLINQKIGEIYSTITALKITDAKQEPTNGIVAEVIKYIIIGVVGAGLMFFIQK